MNMQEREILTKLLIGLGKAAHEIVVATGTLPEHEYGAQFKILDQYDFIDVTKLEPDVNYHFWANLQELEPLARSVLNQRSATFWRRCSERLDSEDLGYLITGLRVAPRYIYNWPGGSVGIHESFIWDLIKRNDERIGNARVFANAVPGESYFHPEYLPSWDEYTEQSNAAFEKQARKDARQLELHEIMEAQDKVAEVMAATPDYADLMRKLLPMGPIERLDYILDNEQYPVTMYPDEIAKSLVRDVLRQADLETLKRLDWLLTYRIIESREWGKFKSRLLSVLKEG